MKPCGLSTSSTSSTAARTGWNSGFATYLTNPAIITVPAVIIMNIAFQLGFCTFVLSNYMKSLPNDLPEAALVDGASVWRQYRSIILPLCRPALGALATLR